MLQVLATYISTLLVDKAGRRLLLMLSSTTMAVCLSVLGLCFHLQTQGYDVSFISWLPLASVAVFIVVFSMGFGPIPWIMIGELFPNNVKGIASAVTAASAWILAFAVTKAFQNLLDLLGSSATFWLFAVMCVLGTIFVAVLVPETKGKTLENIQLEMNGMTKKKSDREQEVVDGSLSKTSLRI
jgi:SP family facilitated glucose transporter-like MFS transporter 8